MDASGRLHRGHALHAALMACALLASAGSAQQGTNDSGDSVTTDEQEMRVSPTMIALLAAVVAVFLLIAASIIYLRHCTGYSSYAYAADRPLPVADVSLSTFLSRRLLHRRRTRGLDAAVVEAFPTIRYAEARALRVGKKEAALECAVCLSEFEDEERLRLLPRCSHAFHPDCIGEWLAGHVTCPVCRCNLDPTKDTGSSDDDPTTTAILPPAPAAASEIDVVRRHQEDGAGPPPPPAVAIHVLTDEEAEQRRKDAMELQRIGTQRRAMRSRSRSRPKPAGMTKLLVRSHSTGHSSVAGVRLDRDLERFTLRLPEHLRREMMIAAGEQSSRGGGRLGRSSGSKWPSSFLCRYTRTLSGRFFSGPRRTTDSSDGSAEVSSSSSTRIRGKRVAAVDFADGSASAAVGGGVSGPRLASVAVDVDKAASRQVRT